VEEGKVWSKFESIIFKTSGNKFNAYHVIKITFCDEC